jgi:hypothetical protein
MSCAGGKLDGDCRPLKRARTACILWTAEERAKQRRIIEERLIHAWGYQFSTQLPRDPDKPWRLLSDPKRSSPMAVQPAWRLSPSLGQSYVEPDLLGDEEARLAIEALTWFRRFLAPLANEPRGTRLREKYETLLLWLNCRARRPGHPTFNSTIEERAGGNKRTYEKLKRQAYRRVERAIRLIKLGLFAEGVSVEPLPPHLKKHVHRRR